MAAVEMRPQRAAFDPALFAGAVLLTLVGLVAVWDAGYARAVRDGLLIPRELRSQAVAAVVAVVAGLALCRAGSGLLRKVAWPMLWVCAAGLTLVLVPSIGVEIGGARRWFSLGGFLIQPSEPAKIACVLALAASMARLPKWRPVRRRGAGVLATHVLPHFKRGAPCLGVLLVVALIERGPDLGTAAVVLAACFAVAYVGGASRMSLGIGVATGVLGLGLLIAAEPFRVARILVHGERSSATHRLGAGYQSTIAEEAIRRGGVFGVGLTNGTAKRRLPAPTTDFVMATVAEETGLVGSLTVLGLIGWVVARLIQLGRRAADPFAHMVCAGVATWIAVQAAVNAMMVNGTIPPIGIPMPFVSNGGSSLLSLWAALGLCQAAVWGGQRKEAADAPSGDRGRDRRARLSRA